uniref:DNA-directed RNA polymerase subunit beta n=1 Tax=Pedinomonas minor TaxID=3159 RepID=C7BEK8_PEDMN|nr:beta subunit of RNA polymerase [Pedinomonas minor]ACQ90878.1 beta subunit of RNA polymerase [Pedinomonas minor]
MSFNNISKLLTPDFLEIQRVSFVKFLESGIINEIKRRNPITSSAKEYQIFFYPEAYQLEAPEFSPKDALLYGKSYASRLFLPVQLTNQVTGEIKFQWVLLGTLPLLTKRGHFILNGCPRVVINQLIRSPGVYYQKRLDSQKRDIFYADFICERGAWLRIEMDTSQRIWARMKRTPKIPVLILLQSMGMSLQTIFSSTSQRTILAKSLLPYEQKGKTKTLPKLVKAQNPLLLVRRHPVSQDTALKVLSALIQARTKKEILVNSEMGKKFLMKKFRNPRSYDLGFIGRLRLNKRFGLSIATSYRQLTAEDIFHSVNLLISVSQGVASLDDIDHLENRRVRSIGELLQIQLGLALLRLEKMIRDRSSFLLENNVSSVAKDIRSFISTKALNGAMREFFGSSPLSQFLDQTNPLAELTHKRRLTSLGPSGVSRETAGMAVRGIHPSHYGRICPIETPEGQNAGLVNSLTVYSRVDQNGFIQSPFYLLNNGQIQKEANLTFLSAKDEMSKTIIPGDIHFNSLGFIENDSLPSRKNQEFVRQQRGNIDLIATSPLQMISVATSLIPFLEHDDANRALMGSNMQRQAVPTLYAERPRVGTGLESKIVTDIGHIVQTRWSGYVSYVDSQKIIIQSFVKHSETFLPTQSIRFLETVSTSKKYSSSLKTDSIEKVFLKSKPGELKTKLEEYEFKTVEYLLENYSGSNQSTFFVQKPIVSEGDWVEAGDILADGSASEKGELALGHNLLVAYIPWEGFNFEDAILISERLVTQDLYTSLHIEKYEMEIRETKFGLEKITNKLPDVRKKDLKNLDAQGIVKPGTWVQEGDILVGKVTPIRKKPLSPHERLLYDIVGKINPTVRDSSLRVPRGTQARVLDIQIIYSDEKTKLGEEFVGKVPLKVQILLAQRRRIQVGDKMAGRHGNKGIISRILPIQDMPYLPDGTPLDIVLNPLGVPSRMNVGQVYECLLSLAGRYLGENYRVVPFDELFGPHISRSLTYSKLYESSLKNKQHWLFNPNCPGKTKIFDGRTGECFDQPVTVGEAYVLKLVHLVDDKIHARSTGPYSLVTQQPLRGRSKHGGQRLGEMEVWALEGFGAAYILQELLTVKSDDVKGRHKIMYSILTGKNMTMGTPECFKVLVKELQSLCLDVGVYSIDTFGKRELRDFIDL